MNLKSLLLFFLLLPQFIKAESKIDEITYYHSNGIVFVNLNASIKLSAVAVDAIKNGLSLNLGYQFKLYEDDWLHWFAFAELKKSYIISYDTISENFILKNPLTARIKNYRSMDALLNQMGQLRDFPLLSSSELSKNKIKVEVRFQIETNDLPVYLKADTLFSSDWSIDSDWVQWQLN